MKKKLLLAGLLTTFSLVAKSQVGINTTTPAATLDVTAKNSTGTGTAVEGLLVPRVDRQKAQSMTGVPVSALIYVNSIATGTATGTALNIDAVGYYYYNGTVWTKLSTPVNIYNADGTLTGNRTVTQGSNTLTFTGTQTNAFSVDGNTLSVDAANDLVGIGTTTPDTKLTITTPDNSFGLNHTNGTINLKTYIGGGAGYLGTTTSNALNLMTNNGVRMTVTPTGNVGIGVNIPDNSALLDLNATNKGLLLPRVSLTSTTDGTTVSSPAKGLMVYNSNTGLAPYGEGLYYNSGTSATPNWSKLAPQTTDYQLLDVFTDVATFPVDQAAVGSGNIVNNLDLGLSVSVTIPANSTVKIVIDYNVPMGTSVSGTGQNGYYGVRFIRNGVEAPEGSRKFTVLEGPNGSEMVSIAGKFVETYTNTNSFPLIATYALNGYLESTNFPVRFNMWSASGANFNWGKATMTATIFAKNN